MKNSERIKLIREIMGLDVKAFASLLAVHVAQVYRWESGMREPHNSKIRLAEKYLDVKQTQELMRRSHD